jgi:zinc protease
MGRQFAAGVIAAAVGLAGCLVPLPHRAFLVVIPTGAIRALAEGMEVDAGDSEDELSEEERTLHSDRIHPQSLGENSPSRGDAPALGENAGAKASRPTLQLSVQGYELANGMRVVVAPDLSLDEVTVVVHYAVGSADDPEDKDGLAHLVEHLMFDGSEHVGRGDYARWIARVGGESISATTSLDSTNYMATVPPEQLALVFWLESDRLGFLSRRLDEQTLQRERAIVTDEARDRDLDRPFAAVRSAGLNKIFPEWHPYHRDYYPSASPHITLDDVRAFLRTWYSPRNATVIVVGRVEEPVVLALAEKYFADLPGARPPDRPALPGQWRVGNQRVDVTAHSSHDEVTFMWTAPALDLAGDRRARFGGFDSRGSEGSPPAGSGGKGHRCLGDCS